MDKHAVRGHALKAITDALTRATAEHLKKRIAGKKALKKPALGETDADADRTGMGPDDDTGV